MDKELEIKIQFLDEAQEYLRTLESALLGLASRRIDAEEINGALRAAHSIKGGAGMMGFQVLSGFAHRLEDSLKVLKIQKHAVEIDGELERLLLAAVDCLGDEIVIDREVLLTGNSGEKDPAVLLTRAEPIFDHLSQRLGDPQEEDASSVLLPEDGQDVIFLLFETEVEGCLERLESVLATPEMPCLEEELGILAQELGGLGEMLQIGAFSQLCTAVSDQLTAHPDQVEEIAQAALDAWRRSQALILTGQFDLLPTTISVGESEAPLATPVTLAAMEMELRVPPTPAVEVVETNGKSPQTDIAPWMAESLELEEEPFTEDILLELEATEPDAEDLSVAEDVWTSTTSQEDRFTSVTSENLDAAVVEPEEETSSLVDTPFDQHPLVSSSWGLEDDEKLESTSLRISDLEAEVTVPTKEAESPDTTVRVSVKRLEQLNDLLGELIIERNGLDLQFSRLRGLVSYLSRRVRILEQSNAQLQLESNKTLAESSALDRESASPYSESATTNDEILPEFDLLELDHYNDLHLRLVEVMETVVQIQEVTGDIELSVEDTEQTTRNLNKTVKQLQTTLNQVRMRPLSDILDRFPRALRELSLQYGKPVNLKLFGGRTLVDRNILEQLHDPLMHLLRNAFDHGIEDAKTRRERGKPEQGTIEIRASHHSNRTLITIRDDGGGIPLDKIRTRATEMGLDAELLKTASDRDLMSLIFEPGFSTKNQVSNLSGRGVGMDVVRNNLKQVRGDIMVDTQPGQGTTFTLWLPFTLSVTRVLIADSSGMLMAFPSETVREIISPLSQISTAADGSEILPWDGKEIPLLRPDRWLEFHCPHPSSELETPPTISTPTAFIVDRGDRRVGLIVNRCWSEQEVAIRPVEGTLPLPPGFASCAILGNGRVVPLVNVPEMLNWISSHGRSQRTQIPLPSARAMAEEKVPTVSVTPVSSLENNTILIVDDSINVRRFLALTLEKAGYRVEQARDGQDALDKLLSGLNVRAAICDIEMPRLDGYGFLAQVKSQDIFKDLPIVMLTSRAGNKHRQLAMSLGAIAYFSKPYNEQSLLQTLETVTSEPTPAY